MRQNKGFETETESYNISSNGKLNERQSQSENVRITKNKQNQLKKKCQEAKRLRALLRDSKRYLTESQLSPVECIQKDNIIHSDDQNYRRWARRASIIDCEKVSLSKVRKLLLKDQPQQSLPKESLINHNNSILFPHLADIHNKRNYQINNNQGQKKEKEYICLEPIILLPMLNKCYICNSKNEYSLQKCLHKDQME